MNVLVLGSGGREHTFCWKIAQSKKLTKLYALPGNAGTSSIAENVSIALSDFTAIATFAKEKSIDLIVVGPEQPLVDGIYDYFKNTPDLKHIKVLGPSKQAALLEGSKDVAKQFMKKHNIPTAAYQSFTKESLNEATEFLKKLTPPYVLKADGLAAGKGVVILNSLSDAINELNEMFSGKFGKASEKVVIEEFLTGIELSVFVLTDGTSYVILPEAKDYKRIGEGDTGLNTGGMGAVSPVPFADKKFMSKVEELIVKPTINGLKQDNIDYKGFVFIGLMNFNGEPKVIEYNVRMGDPETEVVFPRIKNDILDLFESVFTGNLVNNKIECDNRTVTTIVLVAGGYPEDYEKGKKISLSEIISDSIIFHAGTNIKENTIVTNGGRVIAVSSYGENIKDALAKSNKNATIIQFDGKYFRKDIGLDLLTF